MKILFNKKNGFRSIILAAFGFSEIGENINSFESATKKTAEEISPAAVRAYIIRDMIEATVQKTEAADTASAASKITFEPFLIIPRFAAVYKIEILWTEVALPDIDKILSEIGRDKQPGERQLLFIEKIMSDSKLSNIDRSVIAAEGEQMLSDIFFSADQTKDRIFSDLCKKNNHTEEELLKDIYIQSEKKIKLKLIFRRLFLRFSDLIDKNTADSEILKELSLLYRDDFEDCIVPAWELIMSKRSRILLKNILSK